MTDTMSRLITQVEGMGVVYAEANRAKAEHRRFLEERHRDVLNKLESTDVAIATESKRLMDTLASFERKTQYEITTLQNKLTELLSTR